MGVVNDRSHCSNAFMETEEALSASPRPTSHLSIDYGVSPNQSFSPKKRTYELSPRKQRRTPHKQLPRAPPFSAEDNGASSFRRAPVRLNSKFDKMNTNSSRVPKKIYAFGMFIVCAMIPIFLLHRNMTSATTTADNTVNVVHINAEDAPRPDWQTPNDDTVTPVKTTPLDRRPTNPRRTTTTATNERRTGEQAAVGGQPATGDNDHNNKLASGLQQRRKQQHNPDNKKAKPPRTVQAGASDFCIVYVVGGVDPDKPAYRGFLYNIAISRYSMLQEGATSDMTILIRMSNDTAKRTLTDADVKLLNAVNVQIRYIPRSKRDTFDSLMVERFRLLELSMYRRILYLDADLMVRGSLDYLFHNSIRGVIQPNLIFNDNRSPVLGTIFMIEPKTKEMNQLVKLVHSKLSKKRDPVVGWGQTFTESEYYELASGIKRTLWDFPGAFLDNGLLFHVLRQIKGSFSVLHPEFVRNWERVGDVVRVKNTVPLAELDGTTEHTCWEGPMNHRPCVAPHNDIFHFPGVSKPWMSKIPDDFSLNSANDSPVHYWFHMLSVISDKYELNVDLTNWEPLPMPLLGLHSEELEPLNAEAQSKPASPFAYAYVIGGCDPEMPAYRGFLYNIMVNTRQLRSNGSKADIVVFIEMLRTSQAQELPAADGKILNALGIRLRYIPKNANEGFDAIVMEKFRVLAMTEYQRVMFLDGDVYVRDNLDYIFEHSVDGTLKSNVIFAGAQTPAVGSIFVVQPSEGRWDRLLNVVQDKLDRGSKLPAPHWDTEVGWGTRIDGDEYYELANGSKENNWEFQGADGDQGLLYHWAKYEAKDVSIIFSSTVQNWAVDKQRKVTLQSTVDLSTLPRNPNAKDCWGAATPCLQPHSDIYHFGGSHKPWLTENPLQFAENSGKSPEHSWFAVLSDLNSELNLELDFDNWKQLPRPLLGMHGHNIDPVTTTSRRNEVVARFAYTYIVGGCDPDDASYRNFLHNIIVNTDMMRTSGSFADVIVFVQMAFSTPHETLPTADTIMLKKFQIKVEYLPKSEEEGFENLMMNKFRILGLSQYERVIYLDSDVMVRRSLDYLFDMSVNGQLKENVVLSGHHEPAIGGLFLLTPKEGDWDRILEVMAGEETHEHMEQAIKANATGFDASYGWGHAFSDEDSYELITGEKKSSWDFRGASGDLGLLYHWVKYEKKSASILMANSVQNWGPGTGSEPAMQSTKTLDDVFGSVEGDYLHFVGLTKPWLNGPPDDMTDGSENESPAHFWFHKLGELNDKFELGLDFGSWRKDHRPKFGVYGSDNDMSGTTYREPTTHLAIDSPYSRDIVYPHRFAYAYVVGGCYPEDPAYRNYFNDIMISTYVQREAGSTADVVVFVQMAHRSKFDELPHEDLRLLDEMNISVQYIPKAKDESFYRIMLDKFRVLSLTQYERVLFMDSDVVTRTSLDYLFELSVNGTLKENLVIAGTTEPANGGFFMLAPKPDSRERILKIIQDKEERGTKLPYPHWDEELGWGHSFQDDPDDHFEFRNGAKGRKWDFYGAFADQGLLYQWVKYEEKSVTIIHSYKFQNWAANENGKVHMESWDGHGIFDALSPPAEFCWKTIIKKRPCQHPNSDFVHFTGKSKPWLNGPPENLDELDESASPQVYWFKKLQILNDKLQIGLDFKNWKKNHRPFLGMYPKHKDVAKTSYASTTTS